jgi:hypothetical protein
VHTDTTRSWLPELASRKPGGRLFRFAHVPTGSRFRLTSTRCEFAVDVDPLSLKRASPKSQASRSFRAMCGIFAYCNYGTPTKQSVVVDKLLNGLRRLEYRGYDSAGIAIDNGPNVDQLVPIVIREIGKIDNLQIQVNKENLYVSGFPKSCRLFDATYGVQSHSTSRHCLLRCMECSQTVLPTTRPSQTHSLTVLPILATDLFLVHSQVPRFVFREPLRYRPHAVGDARPARAAEQSPAHFG